MFIISLVLLWCLHQEKLNKLYTFDMLFILSTIIHMLKIIYTLMKYCLNFSMPQQQLQMAMF